LNVRTLASTRNLHLAWRRITTGANTQYKKFYRHLYHSYELALDENLADLRARMLSLAWEPLSPDRVYLPKPSGLQRPLTLLHLEDQIVLQAIANVVANKVVDRRRPFAMKSVFSNILTSPSNIFFFTRWDRTYRAFSKHVERLFQNGMTWVADFDLAAFYETISHDLLLRTAHPRLRETDDVRWIKSCLSCWTSHRAANSMGHGLPQGPIASDFLAEVFLLPVDETMASYKGYARYVDDVRLFGATESAIRQAVVQLEITCRERGLIPQV
jgi:retron-type reverse transcriptase